MGSSAGDSDSNPEPDPDPSDAPASTSPHASLRHAEHTTTIAFLIVVSTTGLATTTNADTLAKVRQAGRLVYGSDMEGGGPYAFPDPASPREVTGFEVEL